MDIKSIDFVNLHAHSGVGSPFDGFGYPQDHMDYAHSNGSKALALTDHGNMNGFAYQVLHAKKMKEEGKDFKPIFGVEAYFIENSFFSLVLLTPVGTSIDATKTG